MENNTDNYLLINSNFLKWRFWDSAEYTLLYLTIVLFSKDKETNITLEELNKRADIDIRNIQIILADLDFTNEITLSQQGSNLIIKIVNFDKYFKYGEKEYGN